MKRTISLLLAAIMIISMIPATFAATDEAVAAADALHDLGLFSGVGTDADGKPIYDLDRAPTRHEAIVLLVALLGKQQEAANGNWDTPFTDVADWAKKAVGYAYANKLTSGTSATTFGGNQTISASQYLTFVLTALGYRSGTDFAWDKAWELSDQLGITNGQYNAFTPFTRGDVVQVSYAALDVKMKDSEQTLKETIGLEKDEPVKSSLIPEGAEMYIGKYAGYWTTSEINDMIIFAPDPSALPKAGDRKYTTYKKLDTGFDTESDEGMYICLVYEAPGSTGKVELENVKWTSANNDMVQVVDNKLIPQGETGTTTLTATLSDGATFTVPVVCKIPAAVAEKLAFDEAYKKFCKAFTLKDSSTHTYSVDYNGKLSRARFVEEFDFGSDMWKKCAQRFADEKVVSKDKYASVIGFYIPELGSRNNVFLGNVIHRDGKYSDYWQSVTKVADNDY